MKHLIALALPVALLIGGCQQAPNANTPAAGMSVAANGNGIIVVNARLAGVRKVQQVATAEYPTYLEDLAALRITLKADGVPVETNTIATPGYDTNVAFRNLHAETTYEVVAEAFTADPDVFATAVAVASDSDSVVIDNELNPVLSNLTLQLPNSYFDSSATNAIDIIDGDWVYPSPNETITATSVAL